MSLKYLPRMQVKEIEAIITSSKILKEMVDTQILAVSDVESVKRYDRDMKQQFNDVQETYKAA